MSSSKNDGSCSDVLVGLIVVIVIGVIVIQLLPFIFMLAMIILISFLFISGIKAFFSSNNSKNHNYYNASLTSNKHKPSPNKASEEIRNISYEKEHITKIFKLTDVTYENRQRFIEDLKVGTKIIWKRDYTNTYNEYAVAILDNQGNNLGWVPRKESETISKAISNKGEYFYIDIHKKYGGNGHDYGLEILMSTDKKIIDKNIPADETVAELSNSSRKSTYSNSTVPHSSRSEVTSVSNNTKIPKFSSDPFTLSHNSKDHVTKKFRLTGVTYDNRQKGIELINIAEPLIYRRHYYNKYDENAIEIVDLNGTSLGWVPKSENKELAEETNKGRRLYVGISQKYGGNKYNYGLEVVMSTDEKAIKRLTPIDKTTINPNQNSNKQVANDSNNMNRVMELVNSGVEEKKRGKTTTNVDLEPIAKDQKLFAHYVITDLTEQKISSEQIDYFFDLGKVIEIETIEDCALYCAMMYDSIIDYLTTLKSGLRIPSGRQYLSKEYLESVFPRLDAVIHTEMLKRDSPELLNYFKLKILKTHDSNSPLINNGEFLKLMTICAGLYTLCHNTGENYSQITSESSFISEINFENIDYLFLSKLTTSLLNI